MEVRSFEKGLRTMLSGRRNLVEARECNLGGLVSGPDFDPELPESAWCETKFAPHKTPKLTTRGKSPFNGWVVVQSVAGGLGNASETHFRHARSDNARLQGHLAIYSPPRRPWAFSYRRDLVIWQLVYFRNIRFRIFLL